MIDARDVNGSIDVRANNVKITRTRVTYGGTYAIRLYDGFAGLVVEDVEINCTRPAPARPNGISFGNYVARRVKVTGCTYPFVEYGGPTEIYDSVADGKPVGIQTSDNAPPVSNNYLDGEPSTFSRSVGGWVAQGNVTLGHTKSLGRSNGGALKVSVDANGPWPDKTRTARAGTPWGSSGVSVRPGSAYLGGMYVMPADSNAPIRCEIRFFAVNGSIVQTVEGLLQDARARQWNLQLCGAVAPVGAKYANLRVFIADANYGESYYVDDAALVRWGSATSVAPPTTKPTTTTAPPTTTTVAPPVTKPTAPPTTRPPATTTTQPRPTPPSPPPTGGYPDASTTGPSGSLTPSGSITTSHDGQVIQNVEVTGDIVVKHRNVVIRNVRVLGHTNGDGILVPIEFAGHDMNLLVEDTEIRGVSGTRGAAFMSYGSATVRRTEVSGFQDGFKLYTNNTFEDNWCHDLLKVSGSHNDCMQATSGSNVVIRHNRLEGPWKTSTSAIIVKTDFGTIKNFTIENNLFSGGSYTLYFVVGKSQFGSPTNMTVRNNVWVRDSWSAGPISRSGGNPGLVWQNNTYQDGSPVGS